jgi:sodium transport system ATP-binding protein
VSQGIEADRLTRRFGLLTAADAVELRVAPGQVWGLVGPNGAGKTTTLRMLATLLAPSAGTARVAGFDVVREPLEVRRRLGYLTGETGLYGRLTGRQNLQYLGRLHGMAPARLRDRIEALTALLELGPFLDRKAETLSTGQRQRVSIARAVLHEPQVLVLDEPTASLDLLAAREVLRFFRSEAARGAAVLFSSHILAEVEILCDGAAIIHRGRILAQGTLGDLQSLAGEPTLAQGFLSLLDRADTGAP